MSDFRISKRLVVINSASSLVAKVVNITVILWMYQYLLARIPAEEFAVLPVVMSLMVFAPLFFSFFSSGISRYVVDLYAKGDAEGITRVVSSIFPPLLAMAAAFLVLGLAFALNIERFLTIPPEMESSASWMLALLVVSFAFQMLVLPFVTGFHVRQAYVELNLWGLARDGLRVLLLLIFLLGLGADVLWVVVATAISEGFHSIATFLRSRRMVAALRVRLAVFDRQQAGTLMSFGWWTTLGRLGGVMYTNAATILLNLFGTAVDVTSYYIGATLFRQIESTLGLAMQPLQPVLTAMNALEEKRRLARTVFRGGRYALWATMILAVPLVIYAEDFVLLYLGPDYAQTAMVIIFFMLIFPFTSPTALLPMTAMSMARVREFFLPAFLFQLAGLLMMIAVLVFADWGATGVTLSLTIITVISQLAYFWRLCLRLTETSFRAFVADVLVPGMLPAVAGAIVWVAASLVQPADTWFALLLNGALGAICYGGVLLVFCLSDDERAVVRNLAAKLR
ncbi:MAG: hypothetical protein AAGE18_07525 [Pseudomonadota bacterium]